ncbi:MAG: sigma-54-dependent Fis family transcriptional regulator [Deltaproteobacteria bacterium]|nr:sigma-54-dependent Fis family transcriptional regulator [Deltaproteobacteria bacterium]
MSERNVRILIIDDEEAIRDACTQVLRAEHSIDSTADGPSGLKMARENAYDLILLDVRLPKLDGMEILRRLKEDDRSETPIIIITGFGTVELAVKAMRRGASDVLTKPFSAQELKKAVANALEGRELQDREEELAVLVGESDYMKDLKRMISRIARTESTVLITGESGTGKELVARTIHGLSRRHRMPFIPVDCSSLVESLMESELFGHLKGAFSGATEKRDGRFQAADRGTLFLDEISNISYHVQAKLLRVIQEQEVPRVGSPVPEKVDVRLVVASNRDLRAEVETGNFREDLFYRISVVPIHVAPLREHRKDVIPLAEHFLTLFSRKHGSPVGKLSSEARRSLLSYSWPGNVRELRNTIERLCVLCDTETVDLSDILYYGQHEHTPVPVFDSPSKKMTLVDVEKKHIEKALSHFNNQIGKTAEFLGIDRKTLRTKIRNYGIDRKK